MTLFMPIWQTPSFEELAMNAEIGAYQAEDGEGEREEPFVQEAAQQSAALQRASAVTTAGSVDAVTQQ